MRKKVILACLLGTVLIISGLIVSCGNPLQSPGGVLPEGIAAEENKSDTGILSLRLQESLSSFARTVSPELDMSIESWDITASGPGTETLSVTDYTEASYMEEGIVAGTWSIHVDARNSEGLIIADADAEVDIISDQTSQVDITVSPLTGNGTLDLRITWPLNTMESPAFTASLTPVGGAAEAVTLTVDDLSAVFTDTELPMGYYFLSISVTDGVIERYVIMDSVRVLSGNTTEAHFDLTVDQLTKPKLAVPEFSVEPGTYAEAQTVSIIPGTAGASIRYTTNGSEPSATVGTLYSAPIEVSTTTTLRAVSFMTGYVDSSVVSGEYEISDTVAVPMVTPDEGLYYETTEISFSCTSSDVTILYTIDGSLPAPGGATTEVFNPVSPLSVSSDTDFKVVAVNNSSGALSDVTPASFVITDYVADPLFSVTTGSFDTDQSLTLSCATAEADIHYTLDGSTPSLTHGSLYTGAIDVDRTMTVKAMAVRENYGDSAVVENEYTLIVADPVFSVSSGLYFTEQSVEILTSTPGDTIYYTLDGSVPDTEANIYSDPLSVDISMVLRAVACRDGWTSSAVVTADYELKVSTPSFSLPPGNYSDNLITVEFQSANSGVTFYYTEDGSEPTVDGSQDVSRLILTDKTVKILGVKPGWTDSEIAEGFFGIDKAVPLFPGDEGFINGTSLLSGFHKAGATAYQIQLDDANDFLTVLEEDSTLTSCDYQVTGTLTVGTVYYWRFRHYLGDAWQDWSGPYSFQLVPGFAAIPVEHIVASAFDGAWTVHAADLDGDGDEDILGAAYTADDITWWENDGTGNFTEYNIADTFDGARDVYAVDMDGDGDMDIAAAAYTSGFAWWENDGAENFVMHSVDTSVTGAMAVMACDMDGDSDIDLVGGSYSTDDLAWWENDGSENFTKVKIDDTFDGYDVYCIDLDGDGDMDILGADYSYDDVVWYNNDGSEGFTKTFIDSYVNGASSVYPVDLDEDGDMDVLGASAASDYISWWENNGSESFSEHVIVNSFDGAYSVYAEDIDFDGDMDILGAACNADDIVWLENDGSEVFTTHDVDTSFDYARSVITADIDGDGLPDILGAGYNAGDITWWDIFE